LRTGVAVKPTTYFAFPCLSTCSKLKAERWWHSSTSTCPYSATRSLRLLEYTAMQHREFGKPVYPVVINLTGRKRQETTYGFACLDLTVVTFSYRLVN